jgi:hypothetical protein
VFDLGEIFAVEITLAKGQGVRTELFNLESADLSIKA